MSNKKWDIELDLKEFKNTLQTLGDQAGIAARDALVAAGGIAESYMKLNVRDQFTIRTGKLVESIYHKITKTTKTGAEVAVGSWNNIYSRIHEFGGTIVPRNAQYLTFQTEDGEWHKVKKVIMPERSYIRKAINEHENELKNLIAKHLGDWMGRAFKK